MDLRDMTRGICLAFLCIADISNKTVKSIPFLLTGSVCPNKLLLLLLCLTIFKVESFSRCFYPKGLAYSLLWKQVNDTSTLCCCR